MHDSQDGDIADLLPAARAGDDRALTDLLHALQPTVLRICHRLLPHHHDAEEAAQDALLSISTHLGQYDPERGGFGPWARTIAANSARSTYRSLKRRAVASEFPEVIDPVRTSVVAGSRVDLLDALEALEREHPAVVEAFVLRDLGGLSYAEIAEQRATPLGSVKAQVSRARAFLRGRLHSR